MRHSFAALCVALAAGFAVADDVERLPPWHVEAHALVKPSAAELRWRKIPWTTDLAQAAKTASAEKRPLLVWTTGDPPLERC